MALLSACQMTEQPPPPPRQQVLAYLDWLVKGDKDDPQGSHSRPLWYQKQHQDRILARYYFMPLRPKKIDAIKQELKALRERISKQQHFPQLAALRHDGRWAVAVLAFESETSQDQGQPLVAELSAGKTGQVNALPQAMPVWFFYYKGRWRVVAPPLYGSKEVRALMNLYPQNQALNRWLRSYLEGRGY
jgi:hypothetical protein